MTSDKYIVLDKAGGLKYSRDIFFCKIQKQRLTKNLRMMNKYNNDQYLVKGSVSVSLIPADNRGILQAIFLLCLSRTGGCGDLSATRVMQIYQGAGEGGSVQAKQNSFEHYLVKLFT